MRSSDPPLEAPEGSISAEVDPAIEGSRGPISGEVPPPPNTPQCEKRERLTTGHTCVLELVCGVKEIIILGASAIDGE